MRIANSARRPQVHRWLMAAATLLIFLVYVSHMQVVVNGLTNPYTTDVGEIQNALPRWGTLHFTGYPQYSLVGSLFVTVAGWMGLAPAAAASLYSAAWGAISIALLFRLMVELNVPAALAVTPALLFGLSTSMWIDATIAELHTMTMALTFGALVSAVRYGKAGRTADLYWLAFLVGQGVVHQRAFAFIGLGLLVLVAHRWRAAVRRRQLLTVLGLALLGPLTYLYLPLRAWMGADWTFSSPGTWAGFTALILDTKVERIVSVPASVAELGARARAIFDLLRTDWPWPALALGLLGIFLPGRDWRLRWGLTLVWAPYLLVSLIIWEGRVSDALLAVKLPIVAIGAVGLAFWSGLAWRRAPAWGYGVTVLWLVLGGLLFVTRREAVLAITRDDSAYDLIELVAAIPPAADGRPQTLMALWGDDYWPLAYAQEYEGYFPELNLVHHDRNFAAIVDRGDHLLTLSRTFYQRPLSWWETQLGGAHLTSVAPEIVEVRTAPALRPVNDGAALLDLGNGIAIHAAGLQRVGPDVLHLAIDWQALTDGLADYSIAVHLVSRDPPAGPQDVLAQADRNHPVAGWYPTSLWQRGELVSDQFWLAAPAGAAPVAVRVSMYRILADGTFANSAWLSLPLP